ncbi:MAG: hypothetical protein COA52_00430 [Hyphomicrobiales bacterium]|nr:MAG: hypothetical protein COA52_00430 [Hyphomicrobiales bacterium]
MKAKTIKAVINKKMKEWFESIDDPVVKEAVEKNTIVTGGAIASMLLKENVNDFDVYFRDFETTLLVAKYYVAKFKIKDKKGIPCPISIQWPDDQSRIKVVIKSSGVATESGNGNNDYNYFEVTDPTGDNGEAYAYLEDLISNPGDIEDSYDDLNEQAQEVVTGAPYRPIFMSTNAITLSHKVQLILRFFGEPEEIHDNYDFVHCTNYWTSWDNKLVLKQEALEALLARELRYVGSKYPLCSLFRLRKFIKRGWTINAGQILKITMQLNDMNLSDKETLEDQLTGVDSAYFTQVINNIKYDDDNKIETSYLIELIDRIF